MLLTALTGFQLTTLGAQAPGSSVDTKCVPHLLKHWLLELSCNSVYGPSCLSRQACASCGYCDMSARSAWTPQQSHGISAGSWYCVWAPWLTSWIVYQLFPNRETFQCCPQDLNHEQRTSLLMTANSDLSLILSANKTPWEEKEWWTDTVRWGFLLHAFMVGAVAAPQKHSFCKDPVRYRGNTEL